MAAVVAYRNLMRAARVAFQGKSPCHVGGLLATRHCTDHATGDAPILMAAQSQIRGEFRSKQGLDPKDNSVNDGIQHATEVAKFLRENVVQGKKMEGEEAKYKLRIHEHTERGDNESIKMAGAGVAGGGCCGGSK